MTNNNNNASTAASTTTAASTSNAASASTTTAASTSNAASASSTAATSGVAGGGGSDKLINVTASKYTIDKIDLGFIANTLSKTFSIIDDYSSLRTQYEEDLVTSYELKDEIYSIITNQYVKVFGDNCVINKILKPSMMFDFLELQPYQAIQNLITSAFISSTDDIRQCFALKADTTTNVTKFAVGKGAKYHKSDCTKERYAFDIMSKDIAHISGTEAISNPFDNVVTTGLTYVIKFDSNTKGWSFIGSTPEELAISICNASEHWYGDFFSLEQNLPTADVLNGIMV